jgi:hypothetical protein
MYRLQVAAVDGITSAPLGAIEPQDDSQDAAIPMAPPASAGQRTSKNDDIKMWAVSVSADQYHSRFDAADHFVIT